MSVLKKLEEIKDKGFKPKKILDIGANIGEFSDICKEIWPNVTCYMVEANTNCEKYLSIKGQPYFIEVLSEKDDEEITFFLTNENDICTGNSVYLEKTKHYNEDKLIKEIRKTKTVDSLFNDVFFDLIKLDTQGSELDIIKGSLESIKYVKYIIIETSVKEYNIGAPLEGEIIEFMKKNGFNDFEIIEEHTWPTNDGPFIFGEIFQRDLIFIRHD